MELRQLADSFRRKRLTWQQVPDDLPEGERQKIHALIAQATAELGHEDIDRYGPFAPAFARSPSVRSDAEACATAKVALMLEWQIDVLRVEWVVSPRLDESPLLQRFPELRQHLDKDGLLPAAILRALPDAFEYRGHAIGISDWAPLGLAREIARLAREAPDALRVSLDHFDIVPRREYRERLEEARDFGPVFDVPRMLRRLYEPRVTTVLRRYPTNAIEQALAGLHPLDHLIVTRDERPDRIAFLAEEVVPVSPHALEIGWVTTRILHSDLVPSGAAFAHVDSSILAYSIDRYETRRGADVNEKTKAEGHHKLFWLRDCAPERWARLFQLAMPRNELVAEYLAGMPQPIAFVLGEPSVGGG